MRCDYPGCERGGVLIGAASAGKSSVPPIWVREPCPRCHGTGIIHCCDGEREQPPSEVKRE